MDIQYHRICPKCHKVIYLKSEKIQNRQRRLNKSCKFCWAKEKAEKVKKEQKSYWEPIIGRWPIQPTTLKRIKRYWKTISDSEKKDIISKTNLQKKYFWGHLKRKNRSLNHERCRQTMAIKYSGENHWMKRPEVIAKVKKTCEKYRGDGHWFRKNKHKA